MARVAIGVSLLLAVVLTMAVTLNLRYKPLYVAAPSEGTTVTGYIDTWTGQRYMCGWVMQTCLRTAD